MQPLNELLDAVAQHASMLLGAEHAFVATYPDEVIASMTVEVEGMVLLADDPSLALVSPVIRSARGRFRVGHPLDGLSPGERWMALQSLRQGAVHVDETRASLPLRLGSRPVGAVYAEGGGLLVPDSELLDIFSHQAGAAMHNVLLYAMATTDPGTGTYMRGFVTQRLRQTLKAAYRRREPCSVLSVEVERLAEIAAEHGTGAADSAEHSVAAMLRMWVRDSDVVGRLGSGRFLVVLAGTPAEGCEVVVQRFRQQSSWLNLEIGGRAIPLAVRFGAASLHPPTEAESLSRLATADFVAVAEALVRRVDHALEGGGGTPDPPVAYTWSALVEGPRPT